jgi:uncharacterized membrane protein YdjX (TVP38/TMEM64 family)
MTDRKRKSLIAFFAIIGLIALFYKSGLLKHFSLEAVKHKSIILEEFVSTNYFEAVFFYILIYMLAITLVLPIVMPIALLGGGLFGALPATVYSSAGVLGGMLISFFLMRSVFYSFVNKWVAGKLDRFKNAIAKYGANYFLMLYLLSIVPSFILAALAVVAEIPLKTFIWITIVGNIPLLFICSLAGRQLATIHSVHDILSPSVILSFVLLALLALLPVFLRRFKERFGL